VRATTSPDDELERSVIPQIGEVGRLTVSLAGESGGAVASIRDDNQRWR